mmetsp:Transcript_103909/g.318288  ORF Transcript_103909/g.318288 Transcript_103909/m.318288 type:complete len:210 (-) Transcript_103909:270-899(-)
MRDKLAVTSPASLPSTSAKSIGFAGVSSGLMDLPRYSAPAAFASSVPSTAARKRSMGMRTEMPNSSYHLSSMSSSPSQQNQWSMERPAHSTNSDFAKSSTLRESPASTSKRVTCDAASPPSTRIRLMRLEVEQVHRGSDAKGCESDQVKWTSPVMPKSVMSMSATRSSADSDHSSGRSSPMNSTRMLKDGCSASPRPRRAYARNQARAD